MIERRPLSYPCSPVRGLATQSTAVSFAFGIKVAVSISHGEVNFHSVGHFDIFYKNPIGPQATRRFFVLCRCPIANILWTHNRQPTHGDSRRQAYHVTERHTCWSSTQILGNGVYRGHHISSVGAGGQVFKHASFATLPGRIFHRISSKMALD